MAVNETKMAVTEDSTVVSEVNQHEDRPFVLQCKKCNSIIGDSFSWVCAKQGLEIVSLRVVRDDSIVSSEELETSTHGQDLGSTFSNLKCKSCNLPLGRIYKTTPKELDELRNIYTLDAAQIKCYQFGQKEDHGPDVEEMLRIPTIANLQHEIDKLKAFVVSMSEKLQAIKNPSGKNATEMSKTTEMSNTTEMSDTGEMSDTAEMSITTEHSGRQTMNCKHSVDEYDLKTKRTFAEMVQNDVTKSRDTVKRKKT